MTTQTDKNISITFYRWAGQWGPFKIKIPCGECALTKDIIEDTIEAEFNDLPIEVKMYDWLNHWWKPLRKGGWHAPIVIVGDKLVSQGVALNRGVLIQAIIEAHVKQTTLTGNHVFGKEKCQYTQLSRKLLNEAAIDYIYHDVVRNPKALYEMLARVKPIVGPRTPVTVPQVWLDGRYIGGSKDLHQHLKGSHKSS